jgi:hypothetical protein
MEIDFFYEKVLASGIIERILFTTDRILNIQHISPFFHLENKQYFDEKR